MSNLIRRYLEPIIRDDLEKKMVFIGGPRQVGKTTLAKNIGQTFKQPAYFNWDSRPHRQMILSGRWSSTSDLIIFDELHKYSKWKTMIKGIWDTRPANEAILLTGSSRLDVFRRGGDSLLGRYHYFRLHPLSARELKGIMPDIVNMPKSPVMPSLDERSDAIEALWRFGGFPEPFMSGSERVLKRWQTERFERVFREDIRDLENIRFLGQIELLGDLMPDRIGSPLSINSLALEIENSPKTVKQWMELLCRNYYLFRVPPYHRKIERALKKESKYYLWDWSEIKNDGARFENMVASHLLKWCHFYHDAFGLKVDLYYLRDLEKNEVDFLVVWEGTPWMLVECKLRADAIPSALIGFGNKLGITRRFCVTLAEQREGFDQSSGVSIVPAAKFLCGLM